MRLPRWLHRAAAALWLAGVATLCAAAPPVWFIDGRSTVAAQQAVAVLAAADADGLDPRDYGAPALVRVFDAARQGAAVDPANQTRLDATLTDALLHYLRDRHDGRIDPRQVHARFAVTRTLLALTPEALRQAVTEQRLGEALQQTAPQLPMYDSLRRALAQYRQLGQHPAWQSPLPAPATGKLEEGQAYAGLERLAQRLQALGDLAADAPVPPLFQEPLVSALRQFQQRHGLTADGILGRATRAQLEVTPARRARQIELNLERLRWTPYLQAPRMIVVNVPEFVLRAYVVHDGRIDVQLTMRVIVGKTLDTRTPLLSETMRFIEFSPYWNVPPSIARQELVPTLQRNPAYFGQQGLEFVSGSGQVVDTLSAELLQEVLAGRWRIRQRPGPLNALGSIKFVFPNAENIYLHHTPSPQLFEREQRDFSHGCIRVEEPVALARFVLQDQPEWSEERIRAAMARGEPSTLRLSSPLPVLITYNTVLVKGGRVYFYPDLYGHDRLLEQALRRHSADRQQAWTAHEAK